MLANTYGVFHTRSEHQHAQLARGSITTPEAPEAGGPGSAARCTRPDCGIGGERVQNCVHRRVLKRIEAHRPEVRFCGYVPTRHTQTNNGAELWAALEALQGFRVPKVAILTDSQNLQLRATGRAPHWKSKGWTTTSGKLQVHVPVWEMLLQEMAKPGREVRWEHVPAHVNVQGNEVANGLAMEGMCSSPLWILGSHTPPCHRRIVVTTQFSVLPCCAAAQTSYVPLRVAADCALALAISTFGSARSHHPPTVPVSL